MVIRLFRPELFVFFLVSALVFVLSGCAASPQQKASTWEEQAEQVESEPDVVEEVVACQFAPKQWSTQAASLRVSLEGPVFARMPRSLQLTDSQVTLPIGEGSQGVALKFTMHEVSYRVTYQTDEPLVLYSTKQRALSSVLALARYGQTRWESSEAGRVQVLIARPRPVLGEDFRQNITCQELTLQRDGIEFPEDGELDGWQEDAPLKVMILPSGQEAAVSATSGGPVVETLFDTQGELHVFVLDAEGDFIQVYREFGDIRISGWAPVAVFEEPVPARGGGGGMGQGVGGSGSQGPEPLLCATDVPLFVRVDGEFYSLGTLHQNAAWVPGSTTEDWVEITLPRLHRLQLAPNATYVLTSTDAQACRAESL